MPPKAKLPTKTSNSKDLVSTGPKEVFSNQKHKDGSKKKEEKPSTSRALILRNGKHGSQGTGELIAVTRITGWEKMDLLAEDLNDKSKQAVMAPFRLEECLKIAESQCDVYLDDIANLRDAGHFFRIIEAELSARNPPGREVRRQPTHVAKIVGTRLHNSYMLAAAWKIVSQTLNNFAISGTTDNNVKSKLKSDEKFRERYLVVWDMVNRLVDMSQEYFSVLATTTPHYSGFFKLNTTENDPGQTEYVFDWSDLRKKADSYIDSIITELCFPLGVYPKTIILQLLREAVIESPKEARRFPQALWDAVGDLSVSVQLQELLDSPLFGPDGEIWKNHGRQMPEEYEDWVDAQLYSRQASEVIANFKDTIFPLEKVKKQAVLDTMWKNINSNYVNTSGKDIDALWNLKDEFNYSPQWTSIYVPGAAGGKDDGGIPKLTSAKKKSEQKRLTNGEAITTDDDMPDLQSVSNSDDEDDEDSDEEIEEEDDDDDDESDDSGYNTEEEDEIRELLREAMDAAHESDWMTKEKIPEGMDPLENSKGNPFLKLLGSLRGRMFPASSKLKTPTARTEPRAGPIRGAFRATPSGAPKPVPTTAPPKPTPPSAGASQAPKSQKATVEDASDEDDDVQSVASKKKKKKKPKKKKKTTGDIPSSPSVASIAESMASTTLATPTSPKRTPAQPTSPKTTPAKAPSFMASTTTLPVVEATAQSAHSYLQSLNIGEKKSKSRPDHASLFAGDKDKEKKSKGIFSKILSGGSGKDSEKSAKQSWFARLGKKTNNLMHQLLRTETEARTSMKWEDFVKLMVDMGFTYDPSTAGSSVRFDPPSKNDPPITFHKPHPDPTLQPSHIRDFSKRLKARYGWDEADLARLG